ncbi:MAG: S8 family serine peptidase, partial [Phycisphaerales bacterium]|nr:S8 family serine peptidase [Phycisphaerales bacterium]
ITYVFTISNIGGQPLSIGTVGVAGSGYTVLSQPASPVNAGGTTEFSVRLDAATQGSFNRVLQFLNNDSDENPFVIVLNGTVSEPVPDSEIAVFNGETELQSGDLVFFGNTEEGSPLAVTLQIRNTGAGPLTIGQIRVPAGFSLAQPPPPTINSGDAAPVSFTLDAIFAGAFAGSVTIANNDVNENPFTILTAGFVAASEPSGGVDDANFIDQWHHANDGSDGGAPGYDVRTPAAWSRTLGEQVIVAVMDNGSQPDHPEYNDNVAGQYLNVIQPGTGAGGEHGTAVAGLVAGEANFAGGRGTAPRSQLFLTNTFNISFTEAADAFYAANTARAAVHTNSWGFLNPNFAPDVIVNAIADLSANGRDGLGMNILFAAANDNRPVVWSSVLAVMPETITVGSLTNGGRRSGYSNYGPWLDFVAPSSGGQRRVFTTDLTGVAGYNPSQSADGGDFTNGFGGTSAATPIAAGVLALVHSINPALHADQVRRIMRKASRDVLVVGDDRPFARLTGFSDSFGYGLIDANAAVIAATQSLANGGFTWPEPVTDLNVTRSGIGATIGWINPADSAPQNEYAGAVLVRYSASLLWTPVDGVNYGLLVGSSPAAGVTILAAGDINAFVDSQANANSNVTYAVYTHNDVFHYSDPTIFKLNPREPQQLFFDDMEGADPGWDFSPPTGGGFPGPGGPGDDEGTNEWERGAPVLDTITLEGSYSCNGAPCQLAFFLGNPIDMFAAIAGFNQPYSGANVWATDLDGVYAPGSVHRLVTPVIDLSDPERRFGSFSISWQELLEIEGSGADVARVIIYDADSGSIIRTLINSHTEMTYKWREQWFDLRNQRGRRIQVAFVLTTDNQGQFLGWYIDDVRVAGSFGNSGPLPPVGPRRIILPGFEIFSQMSPDAGSGGDINYDGLVTMEDASELIQQFGRTRDLSDFSFDADLDGNGRIGVGDLILMMALIHEAGPDAPSTAAP